MVFKKKKKQEDEEIEEDDDEEEEADEEEDTTPAPPKKIKKKQLWVVGEVVSQTEPAAVNSRTNEALDLLSLVVSIKNDMEELKKLL